VIASDADGESEASEIDLARAGVPVVLLVIAPDREAVLIAAHPRKAVGVREIASKNELSDDLPDAEPQTLAPTLGEGLAPFRQIATLEMVAAEQHYDHDDYQDRAYADAAVAIASPAAAIAVTDATTEKDDGQNDQHDKQHWGRPWGVERPLVSRAPIRAQ
jgi:hypothetical protein